MKNYIIFLVLFSAVFWVFACSMSRVKYIQKDKYLEERLTVPDTSYTAIDTVAIYDFWEYGLIGWDGIVE